MHDPLQQIEAQREVIRDQQKRIEAQREIIRGQQQRVEAQRAVIADQQKRIEELERALAKVAAAARPVAHQLKQPPKILRKHLTTYGTETWHALYCRLGGELAAAINQANAVLESQ